MPDFDQPPTRTVTLVVWALRLVTVARLFIRVRRFGGIAATGTTASVISFLLRRRMVAIAAVGATVVNFVTRRTRRFSISASSIGLPAIALLRRRYLVATALGSAVLAIAVRRRRRVTLGSTGITSAAGVLRRGRRVATVAGGVGVAAMSRVELSRQITDGSGVAITDGSGVAITMRQF